MTNEEIQILINQLINEKITMVENHRFQTVVRHFDTINNINGDIIECGCWRGGFSIFLSHLFANKKIWVCDSFCGFQPISISKYSYSNERHTQDFINSHAGPIGVPLENVVNNFKKFGLDDEKRVTFVPGYVQYTLPKIEPIIDNIALLRIDVDSYSGTLECLDVLYAKVSSGGYIIFDDSGLEECLDAMKTFLSRENLGNFVYDPDTDEKLDLNLFGKTVNRWPPNGCYIIKN